MKRIFTKILVIALLFCLVAIVSCNVYAISTTAQSEAGSADDSRTFKSDDRLIFSEVISEVPNTIEATVKFPSDFKGEGGVIFSNYDSGKKPNTVCLFVNKNGSPELTVRYDSVEANRKIHTFSSVNFYTGEWIHLALVRDEAALHCYVDGVLMQTLDYTAPDITMTNTAYLGGDNRWANANYNYQNFKGAMKNFAMYSAPRTADEIMSDITVPDVESNALIAYYELEGSELADIIPDISKNNNAVVRKVITGGLEFTETDNKSKNRYLASKITPDYQTIEVMLRAEDGEYGVIYANNNGAPSPNSVNLEITSVGAIKYHAYDNDYVSGSKLHNTVTFNNVKVNTGEWVHVTLVCDRANSEFRCYVNGSLVQTLAMAHQLNITPPRAMYLGRDYRTGSGLHQYTGEMMSLFTYSDVRTDQEIRNDIIRGPEFDENLISYYDMKFADDAAIIPDRSGNGADIKNSAKPINELNVEGEGITVDTNALKYAETYAYGSIPHTIECTFKLGNENKSGTKTIISNYKSSSVKSYTYSFRLVDGVPRLLLYYSNDSSILEYKFTSVTANKLCTGEWVNVALTMDTENKEFKFYVNGTLAQTLAFAKDVKGEYNDSIDFDYKFVDPMLIGSSYATGSAAYPFSNGVIKSVVTYSDVRTADEIRGDFYFPGTDGMTAYWDMSHVGVYKNIPDRSNNFNAMKVNNADKKSYAEETEAMTFAKTDFYEFNSKLELTPLTIEAKIKYPTNGSNKGSGGKKGCGIDSIILGNYFGKTTSNALNFGISSGNNPMVYAIDHCGNQYTFIFDKVTVNTEYWEHIAITFDAEAGYAYCYQNGVLVQKLNYAGELNAIDWSNNSFVHLLGGDWQSERKEYFNRKLGYIALYADVRDAAEIYADAKDGIYTDDEGLMCYYDLSAGASDGVISDNKDGKYDIILSSPWIDKEERDPNSYDYSIAVVGDTQNLTYYYPSALTTLYDWIVANAESKKIGFVMGLGDINEKNSDSEWAISSAEIEKLRDAGIVQSLVCGGNHDTVPQFNKYLPYTEYVSAYEGKVVYGFYDNGSGEYSLANAYQLITIGETKYMFLTLEWAPKSEHVSWANEVIAAHPEYNVIISTHAYLAEDGTRFNTWHHATPDSTGRGASYNGEELWNDLIRKHENIVMAIGGHDSCDFVIKSEAYGDHGNRVVQLLINPQHTDLIQKGTGMVAMLYFSEGGKKVDLEYYSTVQNKHYREENQFSFEMPTVSVEAQNISQITVSLGDNINVNYYAHVKGVLDSVEMRFTVNGSVVTVNGIKVDGLNKYRFIYEGIAPQMMSDAIKAELIVNGEVADTVEGFTVEGYARKLLDMNWAELSLALTKDEAIERADALHALLIELLNYGAEAQKYVDYKADELVNEGYESEGELNADEIESVKDSTEPVGDSGAKFVGATVRFDNVNMLRFDFKVGTADISEVSVVIGGVTYTQDDFVVKEAGVYSVYTAGISAVKFATAYTASLTVSGDVVHSATYSINSYVKVMLNSESIGALASAVYRYGVSAKAYVAAFA